MVIFEIDKNTKSWPVCLTVLTVIIKLVIWMTPYRLNGFKWKQSEYNTVSKKLSDIGSEIGGLVVATIMSFLYQTTVLK